MIAEFKKMIIQDVKMQTQDITRNVLSHSQLTISWTIATTQNSGLIVPFRQRPGLFPDTSSGRTIAPLNHVGIPQLKRALMAKSLDLRDRLLLLLPNQTRIMSSLSATELVMIVKQLTQRETTFRKSGSWMMTFTSTLTARLIRITSIIAC
jgi:hypothetical protein